MKIFKSIQQKISDLSDTLDGKNKDYLMRPAEHLYIGFFAGVEKEVKQTVMDYIYNYAKDYELQRSRVKYRILLIENHPYFSDGYAFEVQLGGDGFSYLDMVLKEFESKTKVLNFDLDGEASVTIRKTPGNIETYYLPDQTIAGDQVLTPIDGRTFKTELLFTENYLFFYVSTFLMLMGFIAMLLALAYKFVWFEQVTIPDLKTNVNFVNAMPIDNLESARSTTTSRLKALAYNGRLRWHKLEEERDQYTNQITDVTVEIKSDGTEVRTTGGSNDK